MTHQIDLQISGISKQEADALLDETPITRKENKHPRFGWSFTTLYVGKDRVGAIEPGRSYRPLEIRINLTALKAYDEHWQTTLESLGVLR